MPSRVVELLHDMDVFADLSEDALSKIARLLKEQKFAENELIFEEGEPGDALYIVLQGRVRIASTDHFGRERVLAFYGPGEFFGDTAVLTGAPRSATASAGTDVRLLQLRKDDFDTLVSTNVGVMRGMLRVIVERQTALNTRLSQEGSTSGGDVRGVVTAVFSPDGGAGKTVLATNLAVALAQRTPDRVVVVDLDLVFGHVAMLLDVMPGTALAAITPAAIQQFDRESLGFYLSKHPESSLRVMVGTLRPEESELVTAEHVRAILDQLRRQFVHVVVDVGSRFSEPCLAALETADEVVVVCRPEAASLRSVSETRRVLVDLVGVSPERITFMLNHTQAYGKLGRAELSSALGARRILEIPFGGEDVPRASLAGFPLVMGHGANAASRAITAWAQDVDRQGQEALALSAH